MLAQNTLLEGAEALDHKLVSTTSTWTADGTLNRMHNSLREQVRTQGEHRDQLPTGALIDSQSIRGAETVGRPSRGYDAHRFTFAAMLAAAGRGLRGW